MMAPFYIAIPIGVALVVQSAIRALVLAGAALFSRTNLLPMLMGTPISAARFGIYIIVGAAIGFATAKVWSFSVHTLARLLCVLAVANSVVWFALGVRTAATLNPLSAAMFPAELEMICAVILIAGLRASARKSAAGSIPRPVIPPP